MRRLVTALVCLIALAAAAAGCGSSSSGSGSPLGDALSYLPKSAPVAVAIDTDVGDSQWKSLIANVKKFPFAGQIESSLKESLAKKGLDFNKDVKPLLGNDFVVGLPTAGKLGGHNPFVGAIKVKDKGKLSSLLSSSKDLTKDGTSNGATLYKQKDGGETAQQGDVLLVSDSRDHLVAALQQHDHDGGLTESDFNDSLKGLPSDALVRLYVDVQSLLNAKPSTAQARKVKWIGALRKLGLTVSSRSDGIAVDFDAKTDPSQLTDADLPIASGDASAPVAVSPGEIGIGLRGLDQTERFAETVAQAVSPASYGDFLNAKKQLGSKLGIDVDKDLIGQLSGNTTLVLDLNSHYAVRAEPKDPAAFAKTLAKFSRVAPEFAQGAGLQGAKLTKSHGLYKLSGKDGRTIYYGMVGKVFAASNDARRLADVATRNPQQVAGAKGAVALDTDAGKLLAQIFAGIPSPSPGSGSGNGFGSALGSAFAGPLGNLTGWADASTSGITGHLELEIR